MSWSISSTGGVAITAAVALGAGAVAWRFAFFFLPFAWTGEPARLARALGLEPGMQVADIGAGSGALAAEIATMVAPSGRVYATELSPERLEDLRRQVRRVPAANMAVIPAGETETHLPDRCCDVVYMRAVFHHVSDPAAFAASVARAVRERGRVGVIDFAPGTLWFHGADHGVRPETVLQAFETAGLRLRERDDAWGGGMFLLVFER
jgi:ubiquinone/menaquinone biosynthesis C-methylase UbiE